MPLTHTIGDLKKENSNHRMKKFCMALMLLAALVCASPTQLRTDNTAQNEGSSTALRKSNSASQQPAHKASTSSSQHSSAHRSTKHHAPSKASKVAAARQRRARLRPGPDRIQEIQQALVKAGYLKIDPTGTWDDQTRDAMRRYQSDSGFPVTGLPEAKSLMKLGLGPHPLPPETDTSKEAKAGAANGNAPAAPSAPASPDAQQSPPAATTPQPQ